MKKLSIILCIALAIFAFASCSDDTTAKNNVDLSDPTLSITECYDIPYQYDLSEYIDIGEEDYIGVEVERVDTTVTDDEVNDAIYNDLLEHAVYNDVTRGAEVGDKININFTGSVDGVEFDGGAAENYEMMLGSAGFIDGFEDALVGHAAGEQFTIDVTFPEDYGNESLKGKAAQFFIVMNSVKEEVLPEFNVDFVKNNYDCDTIEAYLTKKNEELIAAKSVEADSARKSNAYEAIFNNVEFKDYPEKEYKAYRDEFVAYFTEMAKSQLNMDLETYITDYCGSSEEEFNYYADQDAQLNIQQDLICFYIANKEKLWQNLTKGDYDKYIAILAEDAGASVAEFEAAYGSDMIWKSLILDRAINFVLDNSVEVEPSDNEAEASDTVTVE